MKIWLIVLQDTRGDWGSSFAFNHLNHARSIDGDVFLSEHEVMTWMAEYADFWTREGRNLFVYEGEYT